jgi:hypothetical protein
VAPPIQPTPGRSARERRNLSIALAAVVVAAVSFVSFLPTADKRVLHSEGRLHYWGHLVVFSVVGYVASRTARSPWGHIVVFLSAVIFGLGIEIGEHLVFRSPLEWKDVLVDAFGVIAGTLLAAATAAKAPPA